MMPEGSLDLPGGVKSTGKGNQVDKYKKVYCLSSLI